MSREDLPFVDESPEKIAKDTTIKNKENIPTSPKQYRNPSLHKMSPSQKPAQRNLENNLKESMEEQEKDEDSTVSENVPDNDRLISNQKLINSNKNNIQNVSPSKLKRSESLNKPERTCSPYNIKRSESLTKNDRLKRSDSLTKNEKTENNIRKSRELSGSSRKSNKELTKLKRKNGMPERSIKRRHTVGGTKDPDKITWLGNRNHDKVSNEMEYSKEKGLRTSSPDLSSTRRDRFLFEFRIGPDVVVSFRQHIMGARPQSFPEAYKVPLESHV